MRAGSPLLLACMSDPLAPLLELPDVRDAVNSAQEAVFAVHRHPANLREGAATAAEASVRAARASASLDGGDPELPDDGNVSDPRVAGALRVAEAGETLLGTWRRAPLQALARIHLLAAADLTEDQDSLGRPRAGAGRRLEMLADLVTGGTEVPSAVLSAVVHGDLLTLEPFGTADGVVARAAARLTMIAGGLDPKGLTVPEVAYFRRIARYREAAAAFATGEPEGVGQWLLLCCEAFRTGASEARSIADSSA